MILKKTAVIVCVSAAMLCGAIALSMRLTEAREIEMEVSNPKQEVIPEEQKQTYDDGENIPLYYDDEDILLLPVRNVAKGLGGTVTWQKESKNVVIEFRDKKLMLAAGSTSAEMNGYHIMLCDEPQTINGCLYAETSVLSDFFSTEVQWDSTKKQISLKSKGNSIPIVMSDFLIGENAGKKYSLEIPVIMNLNDASYEKGLNKEISLEMQAFADEFMLEEEDGEFCLQLEKGFVSGDFLSLCWKGTKGAQSFYKTINIDLREQKSVNLSDMLTQNGMRELKERGNLTDKTPFYITQRKELAIFDVTKEEPMTILLPSDGALLGGEWNAKYENLFFGAI
ncbi:MAG: copper amine oxidase N-terminal domain-containing protein [Anaerotignum sp.]|nr:copper amine oxidase N-terminal domain-containing protein [Anaerotignum sp.]